MESRSELCCFDVSVLAHRRADSVHDKELKALLTLCDDSCLQTQECIHIYYESRHISRYGGLKYDFYSMEADFKQQKKKSHLPQEPQETDVQTECMRIHW